jgi:hypothetical protein
MNAQTNKYAFIGAYPFALEHFLRIEHTVYIDCDIAVVERAFIKLI